MYSTIRCVTHVVATTNRPSRQWRKLSTAYVVDGRQPHFHDRTEPVGTAELLPLQAWVILRPHEALYLNLAGKLIVADANFPSRKNQRPIPHAQPRGHSP